MNPIPKFQKFAWADQFWKIMWNFSLILLKICGSGIFSSLSGMSLPKLHLRCPPLGIAPLLYHSKKWKVKYPSKKPRILWFAVRYIHSTYSVGCLRGNMQMRYWICASTKEHMGNTWLLYYPYIKFHHCTPCRTLDICLFCYSQSEEISK